MPRSRPAYPPEFRQKLSELMHAGRSPEALAKEFETTAQTIRNWVAQGDANGGKQVFRFVTAHQVGFPVRTMCRVLIARAVGPRAACG